MKWMRCRVGGAASRWRSGHLPVAYQPGNRTDLTATSVIPPPSPASKPSAAPQTKSTTTKFDHQNCSQKRPKPKQLLPPTRFNNKQTWISNCLHKTTKMSASPPSRASPPPQTPPPPSPSTLRSGPGLRPCAPRFRAPSSRVALRRRTCPPPSSRPRARASRAPPPALPS